MTTSSETAAPEGAGAVRRRSASGVTTAIVLATAPAPGEGPAALLPFDEGDTLLGRLLDQLTALGVADLHIITRPGWSALVDAAHGSRPRVYAAPTPAGDATVVHVSPTPADDLRLVAELAAAADGGVVVALGDIVTHGEAVANLLADPRPGSGALTGTMSPLRRLVPRVREQGGAVASAASPYHLVRDPTAAFLGVLQVAAADRAAFVAVAEHLVRLVEAGVPAEWEAELERKTGKWRAAELTGEEISVVAQDVISLLVTALVRDGVRVRSSRLRGLAWARPRSPEALDAAAERLAAIDEDRMHLDAAVKPRDGFFTTFFVSSYSRFIARWAARRGLTPNQITTASALIGLAAAVAFAVGDRWAMVAGAVLLQISFTADCVDGQLARYTRNFSTFGAWLDSIFDRAKEYAIYAGLAIGAAQGGDDVWLLAGCALTLQTVRHMVFVGFRDGRVRRAKPQPPIAQPSDRPERAPAAAPRAAARRPAPMRAALAVWVRLDKHPGFVWARRMLEFPIGERFAAISITAALFTPRTTFVVLLAWGGVAGIYTFVVRVIRSFAGAPRMAGALAILRDDGPIAALLARALGGPATTGGPAATTTGDGAPTTTGAPATSADRAPATTGGRAPFASDVALVAAAAVVLFAAIAVVGDGASDALAGAVVAWVVLCAGAASGARPATRLGWTQLPFLRLCEYGALLWLAALAGSSGPPAAMALLVALAFRHYDVVYRVRLRGTTPGPRVSALAGGWDGRLVAAYVLLVVGALPAGLYVAAAVLGTAFLADTVLSWTSTGRPPPDPDAEEEEDGG
jgi:Family of unknown function (DUF5941)/CDP-alcohol phosphatidyltransferase